MKDKISVYNCFEFITKTVKDYGITTVSYKMTELKKVC